MSDAKPLTDEEIDKLREQLNDCPFCGTSYLNINIIYTTDGIYKLMCETEGCMMNCNAFLYAEELLKRWNHR